VATVRAATKRGTDRAAYNCKNHREVCKHDPALVYGPTNGGCLRADAAEILRTGIDIERRLNLACSGAGPAGR
jgi:hypothetical protein